MWNVMKSSARMGAVNSLINSMYSKPVSSSIYDLLMIVQYGFDVVVRVEPSVYIAFG